MQAELTALHSPDVYDLETFTPEDPSRFYLLVAVLVGPAGTNGGESFDILVCSPRSLEDRLSHERHIWGRHHLIMLRYDYALLLSLIKDLLRHAEGTNWNAVAQILARYGHWEFEDYRPHQA